MKNNHLLIILALFAVAKVYAQGSPQGPQQKSILILNCVAHLGTGEVLENAAVGFRDGKFDLVADARLIRLSADAYDTTIYANGQHLYPGFIAPNSTVGLHEIDLVRATLDETEVGTFKPSVRSIIAYNTDSEIIPTVRSNGVLMAQIAPQGGVISGTSSIVHFDAWNWEDAVIREDDGIHLNWPGVIHRHYDKGTLKVERIKTYEQQYREIWSFFSEAKAYAAKKSTVTEIRYEAVLGLFDGSQTLYVRANEVNQITEAIRLKNEMGIVSMVIVEGYDSYKVAQVLIDNKVSVMLRRVHELPLYDDDDVLLPYKLPALLYQKGVTFCFQNAGGMQEMGLRNLPFYAGTSVAYGLPYEEAVKCLTLNPATIMGIDHQVGSIEVGKSATFFLSKGDALDMMTNAVVLAYIEGRWVDLNSKQTSLYEKFKAKYEKK